VHSASAQNTLSGSFREGYLGMVWRWAAAEMPKLFTQKPEED
jgi:hypothetical protein